MLVVENVPVKLCPKCGACYLTSTTLHELERIKLHRRAFAKSKPVFVAKFA